MDRRTFIRQGCLACSAVLVAPALLTSCSGIRPVAGTIEGDTLVLPSGAFTGKDGTPLRVAVATHAQLKQPIAVFRDGPSAYHAVLMRCTHKGVELNVTGTRLECPAHGSSFDSHGTVLEGPAETPLRDFPVEERDGRIFISLKA
ncbi:MAG TPA: Rieske (2Fe-2S) protein [Flavobacteriales bacterium]|nr:Rieske (2Fe-2S) protein [Flavobacteriales bacterium]